MLFRLIVLVLVTTNVADGRYTSGRKDKSQINWNEFFCSTWFHWPWMKDANMVSYTAERIPQTQTLSNGCTVDVGTCPVGSCFKCPNSGHICPKTETRTYECEGVGPVEYKYVTQCVCCTDHGITVNVKVTDSETNYGIEGIIVRFGSSDMGDTDVDGSLTSVISSHTGNLVISVVDAKTDAYIANGKTFVIPDGFYTPFDAELSMIKKALPFEIDSSAISRIYLTQNPQELSGSNIGEPYIEVGPKSFIMGRRQSYNGPVKVSVNVIDTNSLDYDSVIGGHFLTAPGTVADILIPQVTFAVDFRDTDNNILRLRKIKFALEYGMAIWKKDLVSGLWVPAKTTAFVKERRKRNTAAQTIVTTTMTSGQLMTIGHIPDIPKCYFKTRVIDESNGAEVSSTSNAIYQPEISATDDNGQPVRFFPTTTNSPGDTCFEVGCPTDFTMSGNIQLSVTEIMNGPTASSVTYYLKPRDIENYEVSIKTKLNTVNYHTDNPSQEPGADVDFISDATGPFYKDIGTCETSTKREPAFHFIKRDPPVPASADCTARVAFKNGDNALFTKYLSGLSTLPTVKGISTWYEGDDTFTFIDSAQLEHFTGTDIYFACLKYRCAPNDLRNEEIGNTVLYFDLEIPDEVMVDEHEDGNLVEKSVSCRTGLCVGPFCLSSYAYMPDKTYIDAGLWVENDNNVPGSFFLPADDTCRSTADQTNFAHTIRCNFEEPGE